jgi:transitional endoplasmic reticulum ATPase
MFKTAQLRCLTLIAPYKLLDGVGHVAEGALETEAVKVLLLLSWFRVAPEREIRAAKRASGRLTGSGLVQCNQGGRHGSSRPRPPSEPIVCFGVF